MLGYAFMGKAHSNAFQKIAYMTWPPPLVPRLVGDRRAGTRRPSARRRRATATSAGRRTGTSSWPIRRIGLFDNGGPNSMHAEPTIAAAEAGKHVICEKPLGRDAEESYDIWRRVAATGVKHLCAFNYRFVPAVRLAREMIEAGELGELRHFRGRYLQDWGDDPTLATWRFDPDAAGSGALGDLGAHVIDLARYLDRRDRLASAASCEDVRARPPGGRRDRGRGRVRERRRRHDRGDAVRARPPQRVPVGDQRPKGLARLRHGAPERAPGLPQRRRSCARDSRPSSSREANHPFWEHWWPPGHIIGWGDTFVHELHHLLRGDRRGRRRRAPRRDVRGRLPRGRGVRCDRRAPSESGRREIGRIPDARKRIDQRPIRTRVSPQAHPQSRRSLQ